MSKNIKTLFYDVNLKDKQYGLIIFQYKKNVNAVVVDSHVKKSLKDNGYKKTLSSLIEKRNITTPYNVTIKNPSVFNNSIVLSFEYAGKTKRVSFKVGSPIFEYALNNSFSQAFKQFIQNQNKNSQLYEVTFNTTFVKPTNGGYENVEQSNQFTLNGLTSDEVSFFQQIKDQVIRYPLENDVQLDDDADEQEMSDGQLKIDYFRAKFEPKLDSKDKARLGHFWSSNNGKGVKIQNIRIQNNGVLPINKQQIKDGQYHFVNEFHDDFLFENDKVVHEKQLIDNSCVYHSFVQTYGHIPQLKNLTRQQQYEYLYKIAHDKKEKFEDVDDWSLNVDQIIKIAQYLRFHVTVVNAYNQIDVCYRNENLNKHISPSNFVIQVQNSHCNVLHINKLESLKKIDIMTPSPYYYIDEQKTIDVNDHVIVGCMEEIMNLYKTNKNCVCIVDQPIENIYHKLHQMGIIPKVYFNDSFMSSIKLSKNFVIKNIVHEGIMKFESSTQYQVYMNLCHKMKTNLLTKNNVSFFNDQTKDIFKMIRGAFKGVIFPNCNNSLEIDFNKFFTHCLLINKYIPVIDIFDYFVDYDGSEIQDYNIYIVDNLGYPSIFLNKKISLCLGINLKQYKGQYQILQYIKTRKSLNNIQPVVKEIYDNEDITEFHKKNICNITIGRCGKSHNTNIKTAVFHSEEEANYYVSQYQGKVMSFKVDDTTYYVHKSTLSNELISTFKLISLMVYDTSRIELYKVQQILKENKIKSYACNTDSIFISSSQLQGKSIENILKNYIVKENSTLFETIGKIKISKKRHDMKYNEMDGVFVMNENNYKPVSFQTNEIKLDNEWDLKEIRQKLLNRTIILGNDAGAGKSTAFKQFSEDKEILFVSPINSLRLDFINDDHNSITLSEFLGEVYDDKSNTVKKGKFHDIEKYDIICFDEIYLYRVDQLRKIFYKIMDFTGLVFATGDINQLKSIESIHYDKEYKVNMINQLFPNFILLKDVKRIKCLSCLRNNKNSMNCNECKIQRQEWRNICQRLKDEDMTVLNEFNRINNYSELETKVNVCYTHRIENKINNIIVNKYHKNQQKYYEGVIIKCIKPIHDKKIKIYNNVEYKILDINSKTIKVEEMNRNKNHYIISSMQLENNFTLPYAKTCHSIQGTCINKSFTIVIDHYGKQSKEWIYTSITRACNKDLVNIIFDDEKPILPTNIENRISQHKKYDQEHNLSFNEENYIDVKYIKEMLDKVSLCKYCFKDINKDNYSIDRISNSCAHVKGNVQIICRSCNCGKH